jgi:hypothetical protein
MSFTMGSTQRSVRGLALLILLLAPAANASRRHTEERCIEIMHVGSQDSAIGGVRICSGAREPKGEELDLEILENKRTFNFDRGTYRRLETFVVDHQSQGPLGTRGVAESSFSVTWRTKKGVQGYIVSPVAECAYLDELVHSVDRSEYAAFIEHGEGLMNRERCPPLSSLPPDDEGSLQCGLDVMVDCRDDQ